MEEILDIIYASRTGNSRAIANLAASFAKKVGLTIGLHEMNRMDFSQLYRMKHLLLVVSTHGEGDPPAVAMEFYKYVHNSERKELNDLNFCVLALGDSSYKDYCKTGKDFHRQLIYLGAKCWLPVKECDIDFEETAIAWIKEAVKKYYRMIKGNKEFPATNFSFDFYNDNSSENGMFQATVKEIRNLCSLNSTKQTLHIALSLNGINKEFVPGDSLAIYCSNSRLLVDRLLKQLNIDGTHSINTNGKVELLKQLLINQYEISLLTPVVLNKYAELVNREDLNALLRNSIDVNRYCANHDVLDIVSDYPASIKPEELLNILRKLKPRLYSISCSSKTYPGELHLTLGVMQFELNQRNHIGITSSFLSDRIEVGERVFVHIENNDSFRLPLAKDTPIIMIGSGTGIAAYRAFLQEREATHSNGDNWLIFGERNSEADFLYKNELQAYQTKGVLTRFDTAFSRDHSSKFYVQHIIQKQSGEIFKWLTQRNACVYICGNKRTMAKSVREALKNVFCKHAEWSEEKSWLYINQLKAEKRWQEDVY
jgi:sulfite reductase (NADPH) flavoprotein alpha-component